MSNEDYDTDPSELALIDPDVAGMQTHLAKSKPEAVGLHPHRDYDHLKGTGNILLGTAHLWQAHCMQLPDVQHNAQLGFIWCQDAGRFSDDIMSIANELAELANRIDAAREWAEYTFTVKMLSQNGGYEGQA